MRSAGLRNKPIDRRYLSAQDKRDYNQSGEYGRAAQALSRARRYRGAQAYQANRPPKTQTRTPGTGGFTAGLAAQQMRNRQRGAANNPRRFDGVPGMTKPSSKGDLFRT